jgi:NAD(P)-dependent dehydrogenase (short-subunit alcohol dehydrogenase family)
VLLHDRCCIITGIGPGLGRGMALAFGREGANVVLAARSAERLESVAKEVESVGGRAHCVVTDVSAAEDCDHLVAAAQERFGRIDVLVNSAFTTGDLDTPIEDADLDADAWLEPMRVNLLGSLRLSRAVIPHMRRRSRGAIVMINTTEIRIPFERHGPYVASKGALHAATRTLALEVGRYGIRVNAIVPSYIWGPGVAAYFEQMASEQGTTAEALERAVADQLPLRRIARPEEVADAVVFMASDLARGITGQALNVNCGHHFH